MTKTCSNCGKDKPATTEYFQPRNKTNATLRNPCRVCHNAAQAKFRRENPDRYKKRISKYKGSDKGKESQRLAGYRRTARELGITFEQVKQLIADHPRCMKCGIQFDDKIRPQIDHDHNTGDIRGVLCMKDNTGIGLLGDNLEGLNAARSYLDQQPLIKISQEDNQ